QLAVGDDIYFTDTTGTTFTYQVDQPALVVAPSDVAVLDPTATATLTLTTCNPRFSATSRLIVKAKLISQSAPVPAAPTTT
ncbi:sortase domain-containing protein, partial [Vibrio parahaemolyticus]